MKKYQVTWGWMPPQFDKPNGNFRLFYGKKEQTREVTHKDPETGEVTTGTINEWLCDIVEYEKSDKVIIFDLLNNPDSIEYKKWMLNEQIKAYDSSAHVNSFTIGEYTTWLDKSTRVGLKLRFESEKEMGITDTTLWDNGIAFPLKVNDAINMLYAIEMYASASYDNTQRHIAAVRALTTVEEVEAYDYTTGYPEKLKFEL